jgi:hypothetical protein
MSDKPQDHGGDWVRVATCSTPTEAHLLKGVLQAAGLTAYVADANIVQANTWMTQAVGGVRVLVPASQVGPASQVIAEFNAGAYQLDEEASTPSIPAAQQHAPVFSPDRAALLSFVLTPAFGAGVQLANASLLGNRRHLSAWAWLVLLLCASIAGVVVAFRISPGPFVVFRASLAISFITVVWYFLAVQQQSKSLLTTYGSKYKKRSLFIPALIVAAVQLGVGWAVSELA